ncbi:hypothetical protein D6817_00180 [Candidatus Pacearchaeota archaeon]|nr:MAG: hypothetical protein D6817_00180 [Candidatus Pacearchaeota archaeon]
MAAKKKSKGAGRKTARERVEHGARKPSGTRVWIWVAIAIVVLAVLVYLLLPKNKGYSQSDLDEFAKCLTEKGAVMYGAFWCPHCARTKKRFGSSFKYIKYVECDPRGENEKSELCLSKGIDKYDTWEFADGSRLVSEPTFEQLSEKTGCPLPRRK